MPELGQSADVPALLRAVRDKGDAYDASGSITSQKELYHAARELSNALQPPLERIAQLSMHEPTIATAVRICIQLKLFDKMAQSQSPKSVAELAQMTGADPRLLRRMLQHLATAQFVVEAGPDSYGPSNVTDTLADEKAQGMFTDCFDGLSVENGSVISYFRTQLGGFVNPTDKDKTLFKYAHETDKHYFDWIFQPGNDERKTAFLNHMKFKTLGPRWFQEVPVAQVLAPACGLDDVLLVDVGGAAGHDLEAFHAAFSDLPGRLILQDLPGTVAGLDPGALAPVEVMAHDFFKPQPVRGARAYYLKMVLHDWPDAQCREILENLKTALVPGQSKILINEIVVPSTGAGWFETSVDMLMMMFHAAYERRENEWRELIEGVGLKVTKIWQCGEAVERLIVVE